MTGRGPRSLLARVRAARGPRLLTLAGLAAVALGVSECPTVYLKPMTWESFRNANIRLVNILGSDKSRRVVVDRVLGLRAKRNFGEATGRPNRELWKHFRFEARLGLFDADHADLGTGGSFGVSVLEFGGVGRFVVASVKRSGDGIVVEASTGSTTSQSMTFADSLVADVALESVGGLIIVSAKRAQDAAYTDVAAAVAPSLGPYQISLDAGGIPRGTVVGFDLMRVTANGAPPSPTLVQTSREAAYLAADALAEVVYALDGVTPDRTRAGDQLDLAVARLDALIATDISAFKGVRSKLATARRRAHGLVPGARGRKSASKSIGAAVGAWGLVLTAAHRIE